MTVAVGSGTASSPFDVLSRTPAHHLDLYLYAAILRLRLALPGIADAGSDGVAPFAFLERYFAELPPWALAAGEDGPGAWYTSIEWWEQDGPPHLPLCDLRRDAGVDHQAATVLAAIALVDEDARFGALFGALQHGAGHHPTAAIVAGWWPTSDERRFARRAIDRLLRLGMLEVVGPDPPASDAPLRPSAAIWDALRGEPDPHVSWGQVQRPDAAPALADLILAEDVAPKVAALPGLIASGSARTIVVRGPGGSGRRSLLAAIGRALHIGRLDVDSGAMDEGSWRSLGSLATATRSMPILRIEPSIGETVDLPELAGYRGPIGIVLPAHGSVRGPDLDGAVTLQLRMPDQAARRRHWLAALEGTSPDAADDIAGRYRMTGGNIRRAAAMAVSAAAMDARATIAPADVREASRALRTRSLEPLATLVATGGSWDDLVVPDDTRSELFLLEQRCRSRERLVGVLPASMAIGSAGVRVLFTGPSGAGKTLAARLLGAALEMDVYAVEVGRLVDKYLGETEKNLTAVFSRAAELDAILLVDEGDSLMASRTDVRTSNDRYANLQTNHLLQQLEAHDGIVLVTTNAGDRIDQAFLRRIDVVVEFRAPDALQRWEIWQRHLPPDHEVDDRALGEIAARCTLMGGQIRNAVLHAWLLALEDGRGSGVPTTRHVDAAVRREYRKVGATCPLAAEDWLS
jgi:hypothetical protein